MSKRQLTKQILIGAFVLLCGVEGVHAEQDHIAILQYHHVDKQGPFSTSVTPEQFRVQLTYLEEAGFQVLDLKQSILKLKRGEALPDKAVAITFDDAYRNIYLTAYPILHEKDFPFTVFINTLPVRQKNPNFLTWEQMREMQGNGAVFANHTVAHPYLLRLQDGESEEEWQKRIEQELLAVEEELKAHLGESPQMLAYPYGESNRRLRDWVEAQGWIGFGQQSGVVSRQSDFTNLPRFPASGHYAELSSLKAKLNALPMPLVDEGEVEDYAGANAVSMILTLEDGKYRYKDLACYVAGQGKGQLEWLSDRQLKITANRPFSAGRGRINCTMPDYSGKHFYWYSRVWIRPADSVSYIDVLD